MRITVKQAARQLGVSEQYVRLGLQRGELPIGSCVRMSSVYTYHITQERLDEYLSGGNRNRKDNNYDNGRTSKNYG